MRRSASKFLPPLLVLLLALPAAAQQGLACRAAIEAAERERGIPPRLLQAIARVESGRKDPQTGAFHPWPWTVNAEGVGSFHPTREAAIAHVRAQQARGVRSIDVGCMQVNLRHHPNAFASLEEAFDPLANARYAARFLTELQQSRGGWPRAIAGYHSATPELGEPYRAKVESVWAAEGRAPPAAQFAALAPPPLPAGGRGAGGGFMLSNAPRPGGLAAMGSGRGLDAYRSMPIPVIARAPVTMSVVGPAAGGVQRGFWALRH